MYCYCEENGGKQLKMTKPGTQTGTLKPINGTDHIPRMSKTAGFTIGLGIFCVVVVA